MKVNVGKCLNLRERESERERGLKEREDGEKMKNRWCCQGVSEINYEITGLII